jgi:hypothetical protein
MREPRVDVPAAAEHASSGVDAGEVRTPAAGCPVEAVRSFRCTRTQDAAPACAKTLDEQKARGAMDDGPSNDVRELCPADGEIPSHELDAPLLEKLRSIGEVEEGDELCCYSACVPLDVVPAPADARPGGITICIGAPEKTSRPAAAFRECPAAVQSRVFHDIGALDPDYTAAERAGTSQPRLSSKAAEPACCYDFPRNVGVGE